MESELAPLARWVYEPDEWRYFIKTEWHRVTNQIKLLVWIFVVLSVLTVVGTGVAGQLLLDWGGWSGAVVPLLWVLVPGCLFVGAAFWSEFNGKREWYRRLRKAPREMVITEDKVMFGGLDYSDEAMTKKIRGFGLRLIPTLESAQHSWLCFRVAHYASIIFLLTGSRYIEIVKVLVPKGHEEEARGLVEHLKSLQ